MNFHRLSRKIFNKIKFDKSLFKFFYLSLFLTINDFINGKCNTKNEKSNRFAISCENHHLSTLRLMTKSQTNANIKIFIMNHTALLCMRISSEFQCDFIEWEATVVFSSSHGSIQMSRQYFKSWGKSF
jgi:hypothetical protein